MPRCTPRSRSIRMILPLCLAGLTALTAGCASSGAGRYHEPGFTPTTRGKKLLHYRGPSYDYMLNHTEEMEQIDFDGLILGGAMPFFHKIDAAKQDAFADKMSLVPFKRYTDNFYLCYSACGEADKDFDWFHDLDWVIENWRIMARAAKKGGFKGICFDSEYYAGRPLFGYDKAKYHDTKTFEEYEAQVRKQAATIMRAVNESFPDVPLIMLFGYSGGFYGVPQHPRSSQLKYTLVPAFVDGLLSECGPDAEIHDMNEQAFSHRVPGSYLRARAQMKQVVAARSHDPKRYREHHRAGFSFWADCWGDNGKGRAFSVDDLEVNYYTPAEMAYSIHYALAYSDRYVWMWPGAINWWKRTVKTLDENGKEVVKPLPPAYVEALRLAHEPTVPEPPRDRKPHTWRVMKASTQQGWKDAPTFDDLWSRYTFICDLPEEWRFHLDWDEVGTRAGWYRPGFDDHDWPTVKIREFWEPQGYSPYDGQAWYRVSFTPPPTPAGKRVYLAFGGISDEASVYVNGKLEYESTIGDYLRHQRFLVDVTDVLTPEKPNLIAVRVFNVCWCGGIWKNVKLIAAR